MKRMAAFLCAALLLFTLACAKTETLQPDREEPAAVRITPAQAEQTPQPSPTPGFSVNPVSAFFSEFQKQTSAARSAYRTRLMELQSIEGVESLMEFDEHYRQTMRPNACIGRLSASGSVYADSLLGAASGSGAMSQDKQGTGYSFYFNYDNASYLRGSFSENALRYTLHSTENTQKITIDENEETGNSVEIVSSELSIGAPLFLCALCKEDDACWSSVYVDNEIARLMRIDANGVHFSARELPEGYFAALENADAALLRDFVLTGDLPLDGFLT